MGKTVALAGMFNMNNFGDLLFPIVAAHFLEPMGYSVVPVAATPEKPMLQDAPAPIGLDELARDVGRFSGLVIGGGHIIHTQPIERFIETREPMPPWTGSGLWLGSSFLAARENLPILWNAPGVPHPLPQKRHKLVNLALAAADYCSVRDAGSAALLRQTGACQTEIVPDTIGAIDGVWSRDSLSEDFLAFCSRAGLTPDDRIVSFHARDRSLPEGGIAALAHALSKMANELDFVPVLHGLGQAHKDHEVAQTLGQHMSCRHFIYHEPASLKEIVSVLAYSAAYIGSSLHGYIVAEAHGRAAILIGKPAYKKFVGYLDHSRHHEDLCADWAAGLEDLKKRLAEAPVETAIQVRRRNHGQLKAAIGRHFNQIGAVLHSHDASVVCAQKARFLACYQETLATADARNWLYTPPV